MKKVPAMSIKAVISKNTGCGWECASIVTKCRGAMKLLNPTVSVSACTLFSIAFHRIYFAQISQSPLTLSIGLFSPTSILLACQSLSICWQKWGGKKQGFFASIKALERSWLLVINRSGFLLWNELHTSIFINMNGFDLKIYRAWDIYILNRKIILMN